MSHSHANPENHDHDGHTCGIDAANAHSFTTNRVDPTGTKTIRKRYGAQFYKRYTAIQNAVTEYVGRRDYLGLDSPPGPAGNVDAPDPSDAPRVPPMDARYDFPTDEERIRRFREWFEDAHNAVVLGDAGPTGAQWTDDYVRYAYSKGATQADSKLRSLGVTVPESDLVELFEMPIHKNTLSLFYRRQYDALNGIRDDVGKELSRVLTESFLAGENPMVAARTINNTLDVGITRARTLAHTEMIWAHSTSTLNRFSQILGEDASVVLRAELITAGDDRVCEQCASLEGEIYTIAEARNLIPLHPRCRCAWLPARVDENGNVIDVGTV